MKSHFYFLLILIITVACSDNDDELKHDIKIDKEFFVISDELEFRAYQYNNEVHYANNQNRFYPDGSTTSFGCNPDRFYFVDSNEIINEKERFDLLFSSIFEKSQARNVDPMSYISTMFTELPIGFMEGSYDDFIFREFKNYVEIEYFDAQRNFWYSGGGTQPESSYFIIDKVELVSYDPSTDNRIYGYNLILTGRFDMVVYNYWGNSKRIENGSFYLPINGTTAPFSFSINSCDH